VQEPEPAVIHAAARGDLVAFERLVRTYQPEVWRFLRHLVRDPGLAEDLTQETFIRVYRRLRTFRFRAKFSTWLFQIARNAGIDALRRRDRGRALIQGLEGPQPVNDSSVSVELNEAVGTLSVRLREAFTLVEIFGFTYAEAAATLDIPVGTVKSRVFHARRHLIDWLQASEGGEAGAL
jgi:RNA polymerase sigma-70 factor (ECF subfamily)